MKPYLATLSARFRMMLQYRAAAFAGVMTQVFFGLIRVMIFQAFYHSTTDPQPLTAEQTTTYLWLGQAFLLLTMLGADNEIAALIRSGDVSYELIRPVDLYNYWLARSFSSRAAPMILRAIPILIFAALIGHLTAPVSLTHALLFLVSLTLGLILSAVLFAVVTISILWTISGDGI